jgi:hypothetical protein
MLSSLDLVRDYGAGSGHGGEYGRYLGDGSTSEGFAPILSTLHLKDILLGVKFRNCGHQGEKVILLRVVFTGRCGFLRQAQVGFR